MKKTSLYDAHLALGAKMVPFAGYEMPIQYKAGIIQEHHQVRHEAGLFDVSHMGQIQISGAGAGAFFSRITPSDFTTLPLGVAKYTVMTNENGGIIDDLIVTRLGEDRYFAVINAGCKEKDIAWIQSQLPKGLKLEIFADRSLIAIQGQFAEEVLQKLTPADLKNLGYMRAVETTLMGGLSVLISRTGYTGEDGFEVSVVNEKATAVWNKLLEDKRVHPAGLGARDVLRIEMGYHLYGHDMDENTLPVAVGLGWVMTKGHEGFIGSAAVLAQKAQGAPVKRVGLKLQGKVSAREGAEIFKGDRKIGLVTSGAFSPLLDCGVSHGSIETTGAVLGDEVNIMVRNKPYPATIVKFPFIQAKTKA